MGRARLHRNAGRASHTQPRLRISVAGPRAATRCSRSSCPLPVRVIRVQCPLSSSTLGTVEKHRGINSNAKPCGGPRGVLRWAAFLVRVHAAAQALGEKGTHKFARTSPVWRGARAACRRVVPRVGSRCAGFPWFFSSDAAPQKDNGRKHLGVPGDNGPILCGPNARLHCNAGRAFRTQTSLRISVAGPRAAKRCSRSSCPLSLRGPRIRCPLSSSTLGAVEKHRGISSNAKPCGGPRGVLRWAAFLARLRAAAKALGGRGTHTLARASPLWRGARAACRRVVPRVGSRCAGFPWFSPATRRPRRTMAARIWVFLGTMGRF